MPFGQVRLEPEPSPVPPAPRRPSQAARRLIYGYGGSQGVTLLVGAALLVIGVPFVAIFGWGVWRDLAIDLGTGRADGTVLAARLNRNVKINGRHPTEVRFRYQVDGRALEAETDLMDPDLPEAPTGSRIAVEYARGRPEYARLAGGTASTFGYPGLMALLFPLVGAALAVRAVRSNRREIRAFVHGRPILAEVVYFGEDPTTRVNGRHPYLLRWRFEVAGVAYQGSLSSMDAGALEPLGQRGRVTALYLPEDPSANTLWIG